jgi:hypothetical protein
MVVAYKTYQLDDYGYVNKKLVVLSEQDDLETTGFDKVKERI